VCVNGAQRSKPFIFPFLIEFHNTIAYILYLVYIYTIIHVIILYDFFVSFFFLLALFRKKKQTKNNLGPGLVDPPSISYQGLLMALL
jgi:hypothetical protein